jgi:hypothetical protein
MNFTNTSSLALMEVAALNPREFARLKGHERKAAHAALLALLAQVSDGEEQMTYRQRAQRAWAEVGSEAA